MSYSEPLKDVAMLRLYIIICSKDVPVERLY
jgi:hypothetical protein